jgi:uncharacterized protein YjbI with pentapeptide repeats
MNIASSAEAIHASDSNLSGSSFRDVNLSDAEFTNARCHRLQMRDVDLSASLIANGNLGRVRIEDCNVDGMSIDGVLVSDMLAAYLAAKA